MSNIKFTLVLFSLVAGIVVAGRQYEMRLRTGYGSWKSFHGDMKVSFTNGSLVKSVSMNSILVRSYTWYNRTFDLPFEVSKAKAHFYYSPRDSDAKMSMSKIILSPSDGKDVDFDDGKWIVNTKTFCWYMTKYLKPNQWIPALTRSVCY